MFVESIYLGLVDEEREASIVEAIFLVGSNGQVLEHSSDEWKVRVQGSDVKAVYILRVKELSSHVENITKQFSVVSGFHATVVHSHLKV